MAINTFLGVGGTMTPDQTAETVTAASVLAALAAVRRGGPATLVILAGHPSELPVYNDPRGGGRPLYGLQLGLSVFRLEVVPLRPCNETVKDGLQLKSLGGRLVIDTRRDLVVRCPSQKPRRHELLQSGRKGTG